MRGDARLSIYLGVDDVAPSALEELRKLASHKRVVEGYEAGDDNRGGVPVYPDRVHQRCHQPQHATRLLEAGNERPGSVERVEQLGVDRIGIS